MITKDSMMKEAGIDRDEASVHPYALHTPSSHTLLKGCLGQECIKSPFKLHIHVATFASHDHLRSCAPWQLNTFCTCADMVSRCSHQLSDEHAHRIEA